jgi:hypothetical protein
MAQPKGLSSSEMEEMDANRKLTVFKHRKKQAANDAQLLMSVFGALFSDRKIILSYLMIKSTFIILLCYQESHRALTEGRRAGQEEDRANKRKGDGDPCHAI